MRRRPPWWPPRRDATRSCCSRSRPSTPPGILSFWSPSRAVLSRDPPPAALARRRVRRPSRVVLVTLLRLPGADTTSSSSRNLPGSGGPLRRRSRARRPTARDRGADGGLPCQQAGEPQVHALVLIGDVEGAAFWGDGYPLDTLKARELADELGFEGPGAGAL